MSRLAIRHVVHRSLAFGVLLFASRAVGAESAFASAGGGSAGFGGGHGGGGRSLWVTVLAWVAAIVFAIVSTCLYIRRVRKRRERVVLAAAVAAKDDPAFAPDLVCAAGEALFRAAQSARDARDDARLAELLAPDLLAEWRLRLADFEAKGWHNQVRVEKVVSVDYVGLVNRAGRDDDRVTVLILARLLDVVVLPDGRREKRAGEDKEVVSVEEYWTLAQGERGWVVASIEDSKEGRHVLQAPIVATPWDDAERIGDAAVHD